jgi:hypothetical protein
MFLITDILEHRNNNISSHNYQLPFDQLFESSVTKESTQGHKIAIFRSLFRGREDVYPRRFESKRSGKRGFQPVCRNEWIRPICQKPKIKNLIVMKGGMGKKQRQAALNALESLPDDAEKAVLATGRYLGEGFDDERLDTLFLTLPISWRGTLNQYAGRLHRIHESKKEVVIYDYVDLNVPVLLRMYKRRIRGYRSIGYEIMDD